MKKKFGQNFLNDLNVVNKIVEVSEVNNNSNIYEVGPGKGILTNEIIKKNPNKYIAVEIDNSLKNNLEKIFLNTKYKIFFCDALNFDETLHFDKNTTIISNLPYNISLTLLIKWIYQLLTKPWISQMTLMFQKEVAERIIAKENTKKFGRITLLVSAFFDVSKILEVDKTKFFPSPKVNSAVLNFKILKKSHFNKNNINKLEFLSKTLFANRRKKLKAKIQKIFTPEIIKKNNLSDYYDLRVENLNIKTFFNMAKLL